MGSYVIQTKGSIDQSWVPEVGAAKAQQVFSCLQQQNVTVGTHSSVLNQRVEFLDKQSKVKEMSS
ncbi:hypothetical protein J6590_029023 [Homalodisca vitripennis]|nr:hypothetical protein J6590_029023 [Homalodisca vitripennis]